ncbi:Conserved membrane protein in copper uptake [Amycolatopsis camponoti]|uniref:Conserved membrane protein in copper uptake n=1 Tax=Amycolatopsis camponoti TaxID=2606593 RepID=A0A6I8LM58_9PSEU|nr:YcnI family protein [Amycolatopsis camponoti]VVJ17478.1 Conserved membrane protein in copper uptake [Amycolatopsis camponoti]
MRAPPLRIGRPKPPRLAVAALAAIAVMLACPAVAAAHVSATPDTVEPGEPATISLLVPNERDDATTVRLEVLFPDRPAVVSATPQNLPGWKISVRPGGGDAMADKPVTSIVWEGGTVPAGTFQEFPVRIGGLPTGTLAFQVLQTYSDGQVVRWADPAPPGQPEPEHPAPVVTVAPAPVAEVSDVDVLARVLGGAALGVALVAAGVAWLRRRPAGVRPETACEAPEREKVQL